MPNSDTERQSVRLTRTPDRPTLLKIRHGEKARSIVEQFACLPDEERNEEQMTALILAVQTACGNYMSFDEARDLTEWAICEAECRQMDSVVTPQLTKIAVGSE